MDNRLNRILHNKPVKLFYFVRNLARYAVPHRLLQKRLEGVLAEVASRDDRDYILQRVDYYNRLPAEGVPLPEGLHPLGEHRLGRGVRTAYFFDSYEFTRWFDDGLLWNMIPGDVTEVPPIPSVVKSRPIAGDNANSVLLNLDKFRHFVFLRDDIPFRAKEDRGSSGARSTATTRTMYCANASWSAISARHAAMRASRTAIRRCRPSGRNPTFRCTTICVTATSWPSRATM